MAKPKKIRKTIRKKVNKSMRRWQFKVFIALLAVGFLVSWMLPLRPKTSESEKRELTAFPTLSVKALASGTFFDGINLWFSDTFPFREAMVTANGKLKSLYGFGTQYVGLTDEKADEIPDEPNEPVALPVIEGLDPVDDTIDETIGGTIEVDNALVQNLGALVVVNDAAYEVYNFVKDTAERYAAIVSRTAQNLEGVSDVYDLVVPTSVDITMPDKERAKINSSSQADAMRYIFSCMTPQVHSVNVYNVLRSHRTEYIYYRTDHHWTALGAYYAYTQFCRAIQDQPKPLDAFEEFKFDGFKGSFVAETKKNAALENHPDTVYAYKPKAPVTLQYTDKNGRTNDWEVIYDVSEWSASSKYSTFIGGDNPYTILRNASITEPKTCLVVKESFGNAMVPFIAANFSEVHVVDYRYWRGSVSSFAKEHNIDCVLFINNISATRSASLMNTLQRVAS